MGRSFLFPYDWTVVGYKSSYITTGPVMTLWRKIKIYFELFPQLITVWLQMKPKSYHFQTLASLLGLHWTLNSVYRPAVDLRQDRGVNGAIV
jgi:hypothetical protein